MFATLATVRSRALAAVVIALATAAFRPSAVEDVSIAAEIRFDADVRVRQLDVRADEDLETIRRQDRGHHELPVDRV